MFIKYVFQADKKSLIYNGRIILTYIEKIKKLSWKKLHILWLICKMCKFMSQANNWLYIYIYTYRANKGIMFE